MRQNIAVFHSFSADFHKYLYTPNNPAGVVFHWKNFMKYATISPIQKFEHYGYHFVSNSSARLIYRDSTYCIVILLE